MHDITIIIMAKMMWDLWYKVYGQIVNIARGEWAPHTNFNGLSYIGILRATWAMTSDI